MRHVLSSSISHEGHNEFLHQENAYYFSLSLKRFQMLLLERRRQKRFTKWRPAKNRCHKWRLQFRPGAKITHPNRVLKYDWRGAAE